MMIALHKRARSTPAVRAEIAAIRFGFERFKAEKKTRKLAGLSAYKEER